MSDKSDMTQHKKVHHNKVRAKKILLPKKERYAKKTFLRIFYYTSLIALFIMLITVVSLYFAFKDIVTVETYKKSIDLLNQTQSIFSSLHSWVIPSFFSIKTESSINYLIYSNKLEKIKMSAGIDRLDEIITSFNLFHSIYIYNYQTGDFFSTVNGYEGKECSDFDLSKILYNIDKYGVYRYIPRKMTYRIRDNVYRNDSAKIDTVNVFSVVVGNAPETSQKISGALVINISEEKIRKSLLAISANTNEELFIINRDGVVLTHPDKNNCGEDFSSYPYIKKILDDNNNEGVFIETIGGSKYLVSYLAHSMWGWRFINITPHDKMFSSLKRFLYKTVFIFILLIFLIVLLAFISSLSIYSPIHRFFQYSLDLKEKYKDDTAHDGEKKLSELQYLDRTFKQIVKKADFYEDYICRHEELHKQEVLKALLLGDIEADEFENYKESVKDEIEEGPFIMAVLRLDKFNYLSEVHDTEEINKLFGIMREMVFHYDSSIKKIYIPLKKDHVCIIFNLKSKIKEKEQNDFLDTVKSILKSIQAAIYDKFNYTITIGLSRVFENCIDFNEKYKRAFHATQYRFRFGHNSLIYIDEIERPKKEIYIFPEEKIKKILNELKLGRLPDIEHLLDDIMEGVKEYDYEDFTYMIHFITYHTNIIIEKMKNNFKSSYSTFIEFIQEIKFSETIDDLKSKLIEVYTMMYEILQKNQSSKAENLANKIKEYINNHYNDPTLCVDSLSGMLGFTSYYVRFTFRKVFNISISEYINNIRLEYCKEQLVKTKYAVKKIYISAGFYNYSYFFTLFKKETGLTPNQYRLSKI